jgi:hypothetical protein
MEDEFRQLHGLFQKFAELHKHLKQFKGQIPEEYVRDVKILDKMWRFQKSFVNMDTLPQHFETFCKMKEAISSIQLDFYFHNIL